jgi:hypothetical protein
MIDTELRDALCDTTTHIAQNCGSNFTYPSKYAYLFSTVATSLDFSYATLGKKLTSTSTEFVNLKYRTNVTRLNLSGQDQLSDKDLQDTLKTMTGLVALSLNGTSGLASIDFIGEDENEDGTKTKKVTKLKELDIRDTASTLTDLSNLNAYSSNLLTLVVNNSSIDMLKIQTTINALSPLSTDENQKDATFSDSWIDKNSWGARGMIILGNLSGYNFSKCTEIKKIRIARQYFSWGGYYRYIRFNWLYIFNRSLFW